MSNQAGISAGGLVGDSIDGTVIASYASGGVTAPNGLVATGGLIGAYHTGKHNSELATGYWIQKQSESDLDRRTFGIGGDDRNGDIDHTDPTDYNNILDTDEGEINRLMAYGLTVAQMRANANAKVNDAGAIDNTDGKFPDFRAVEVIIGTATVPATMNFSAAWNYTPNCFPRLNRWTGNGPDTEFGTADDTYSDAPLRGQEQACAP